MESRARPTDAAILALRGRQSRALLATLLLSFGVPMILGGDELGRTQQGNNNAYCQDNPITWFDWSAVDAELLAFTRHLVALRRSHPVFRRRRFLRAPTPRSSVVHPGRHADDRGDWQDPGARSVAVCLDGADARTGPTTAATCSTTTSSCWSTPGGSRCVHGPGDAHRSGMVAEIDPSTRAPQLGRRSSSRPKRCWWGPFPAGSPRSHDPLSGSSIDLVARRTSLLRTG